jgi:glycerol-3-phosphate dehydrogenase
MVINAAGPWAHRLLASQPDLTLRREPSFSRDLAFVVDKAVSDTHAIGCQAKSTDSDAVLDRGSRHLFLVPWHGKTLVGVWHGYTEMHPEKVVISRNELQGFLDEINGAYTGLDLTLDDIRMIYSGLILFGAKSEQGSAANHSFSKRALIHDHSKEGIHGIISVIGDRATVARRVAEKTVDMVANRIRTHTSARPATVPLRGGDIPDFEALVQEIRSKLPAASQHAARALAHNHGASYQDVFSCASLDDHLSTIGDSNVLAAEIIHAARSEMAFTLEDIVIRRTDLGSGGNPGDKAISVAADLAAHELGWTQQQRLSQIASLQELFQNLGPWVLVD